MDQPNMHMHRNRTGIAPSLLQWHEVLEYSKKIKLQMPVQMPEAGRKKKSMGSLCLNGYRASVTQNEKGSGDGW